MLTKMLIKIRVNKKNNTLPRSAVAMVRNGLHSIALADTRQASLSFFSRFAVRLALDKHNDELGRGLVIVDSLNVK